MDDYKAEIRHADRTQKKIEAITNLKNVLGKAVGSGFVLRINDLTGKEIAHIVISGESLDPAIQLLINGIKHDLELRVSNLKAELADIEKLKP